MRERQHNGNQGKRPARYALLQYAINVCYELLSGHVMTAVYLPVYTYIGMKSIATQG
jgi:hypothetical protein